MNKSSCVKRICALVLSALMLAPAVLAVEPEKEGLPMTELVEAVPNQDWALVLVGPQNSLSAAYCVELTRLQNGMEVDCRIYSDLDAMLTACWAAGLRPQVCSAYRTLETQTRLYNNKVARLRAQGYTWASAKKEAARWVALPDTSEHQTGLALDLVSADYPELTEQQADTPEQRWLMEHCWEYGFILRYPQDKTAVTGIGYEPWHYRYVGKVAAAAIHETGLCLEEYLLTQPLDPVQ